MRDDVGRWLDAAGRAPLLTVAEELELGRLVRCWQDWAGGGAAAGCVRRGSGAAPCGCQLVASSNRCAARLLKLRPSASDRRCSLSNTAQLTVMVMR